MRKKILIIDDDINIRENIATLLSEEGYDVISAKDGKIGIKMAKEEIPDLILCDILMKGIDGYDVLEDLSNDNLTRMVPFIFLTAKVEMDNIRLGMRLGADDYIVKPFSSDDLLKSIETRLRKIEGYKSEPVDSEESSKSERYLIDDKIFARIDGTPVLLKVNDILLINAENQFTSVRTTDGKTYTLRRSLAHWEESLPQKNFLRIHRGTIVNTNYLVKIEKWYKTSLLVYLKDIKEPLVISKRYATKIRKNFL